MLTTREIYTGFISRMAGSGLGLGALFGALFTIGIFLLLLLNMPTREDFSGWGVALVLMMIYLIPGAIIGAVAGMILGIILGVILAFITRLYFYPAQPERRYINIMGSMAFLSTLIIGPIVFLLTNSLILNSLGIFFLTVIPSIIAASAAAFAARRTAVWYVKKSGEVADYFTAQDHIAAISEE